MKNRNNQSISVVVPVYNSETGLQLLVERIEKSLRDHFADYEIILVNDGSVDGSWNEIVRLSEIFSRVRGVNLMRNYGQHNATLCGIREARCDLISIMDDDLQYPPEEIPRLIDKLNEGYGVVYGVPQTRQQAWWKDLSSRIIKRAIAYVMGARSIRDIGAFKVFRAELRRAFEDFDSPDVLVDVLLSWGTTRFASITIEEAPRKVGKSNYNFFKLVKVSLLVLTSYTTIPLRIASLIGFLFTLFGMGVLVYVLIIYFTVGSIPGFPFLASTVTLFSGVQLFALGIMGEYLARIFDRTGGRPSYTVGQKIE